MRKYFTKKYLFLAILFVAIVVFLNHAQLLGLNRIEEKEEVEGRVMYVEIDNKNYLVELESNETVTELLELLPRELDMSDLNSNEKYAYIEKKLTSDDTYYESIKKGEIVLYNKNCIVIFYEDIKPSVVYTKIGYINNLPDLGSENIRIKFKK